MTLTSTDNSSSIFENGKLKAGIYKIQNLHTQGYVDVHEHLREVCCRPIQELQEGTGLWEIKPLGAGYTVQRIEPGKPEHFCAPMVGLQNGCALSVVAYPVAWRVEVVDDVMHRGFEYVRFYWGITKMTWDIDGTKKGVTTKVQLWEQGDTPYPYLIWKLTPAKTEDMFTPSQSSSENPGSSSPPSYGGDTAGQFSTSAQRAESEHDGFGTIVTEVIVATTTTRKRYRVEDA